MHCGYNELWINYHERTERNGKEEMEEMKKEMKKEMQETKKEMKKEMQKTKKEMMWFSLLTTFLAHIHQAVVG